MVALPRVLLLALVATLALTSCCLVGVFADDIQVDDPDVTVLTDDNFEAFIQGDLQLVEFYAPWCGQSTTGGGKDAGRIDAKIGVRRICDTVHC